MHKNGSFEISEQWFHKLLGRGLRLEPLGSRRWPVLLLHALSFCFWLVMMGPDFMTWYNVIQELFIAGYATSNETKCPGDCFVSCLDARTLNILWNPKRSYAIEKDELCPMPGCDAMSYDVIPFSVRLMTLASFFFLSVVGAHGCLEFSASITLVRRHLEIFIPSHTFDALVWRKLEVARTR